jgi:hypothetical protein
MHGSSEIVRNRAGAGFTGGGILNCDTLSGVTAGTNVVDNYPDDVAQGTACS